MSLKERIGLYSKIEKLRKRPLVVYATSSRPGASGNMAADVIPQLLDQVNAIPSEEKSIDLLVVSSGGDPSVAWRTICLLRERFDTVGVLVPSSAFSAATLLCLGADEIVMHRYGNLGPVDPQVTVRRKQNNEQVVETKFGYEEIVSFIQFIRERAHITDQVALTSIVGKMLDDTGTVSIGVAVRGSMLSLSLGENLLRMHMKGDGEAAKAKDIAEILNKKFFHHGHALGRTEAKAIGLKVADCPDQLGELMWKVWTKLEAEMKMREPFSPMAELMKAPAAAPLFAPTQLVSLPQGLPQPLLQSLLQQIGGQIQLSVSAVPPIESTVINAVMESRRICSRFATQRRIFGTRQPDAHIQLVVADVLQGWEPIAVPSDPGPAAEKAKLPPVPVDVTVSRASGIEVAEPLGISETNGRKKRSPKKSKKS